MSDERTLVLDRIEQATTATELFGANVEPKRGFRKLLRVIRPDVNSDARTVAALQKMQLMLDGKTPSASAAPTPEWWTLTTKRGSYAVGRTQYAAGTIANLYALTFELDGTPTDGLLKMPRSAADNDLMAREAKALARIRKEGDPKRAAFVPQLIDRFMHQDADTGVKRNANILEFPKAPGPWYTFKAVHNAYPQGVDPRDAAWMFRRLLVAIGYAHDAGVFHGAVVPDNVMIHAGKHGLVLVDWCYSVFREEDERVPALADAQSFYPPEVLSKERPTKATDLFMAARCFEYLIGERINTDENAPFRAFVKGSTIRSVGSRPSDAWELLTEFDALLERKYGPRRFRPFRMPEND